MIPIGGRVIVQPKKVVKETAGGILIPDNLTDLPSEGVVVAVGRDKQNNLLNLNVGAVVSYNQFAVTPFDHEGQAYAIVDYNDIYGVTKEAPMMEDSWTITKTSYDTPIE